MRRHPKHDEIKRLRQEGCSFNEISRFTGANKSTIHYIVRGIELTGEQQNKLKECSLAGGARGRMRIKTDPACIKGQREGSQKANRVRWQAASVQAREVVKANLKKGSSIAGLTYRKDELSVKAYLEGVFNCSFHKERIGRRFVDFANDTLLIEYTTDGSRGVQDAFARLLEIVQSGDIRRKIACLPLREVGSLRRGRFVALGVELRNVGEGGKLTDAIPPVKRGIPKAPPDRIR